MTKTLLLIVPPLIVFGLAMTACGGDQERAVRAEPPGSTEAESRESSAPRGAPVSRSERPRVDARARLDVSGVPAGITLEMGDEPISGAFVLDAGSHRIVVHCDGKYMRTITVELRVGETTRPDLDWVPQALTDARRHEAGRREGTCTCKRVIEHGVDWLVTHRSGDGAWRADTFIEKCPDGVSCGGAVTGVSPIETTTLALLALLGIGETHDLGDYRSAVRAAGDYIVGRQAGDGVLAAGPAQESTRIHALGALALTELMVMTGSRRYREPAQRAVNALVARRRPGFGWSRDPSSQRPDAETTCWATFVMSSAASAKLAVPSGLRAELSEDLAIFGDPGGTNFGPRLSAMLTLAWIENGAAAADPAVTSGLQAILASPPLPGTALDPAFAWFAAAVVFRVGGDEAWEKWSRGLAELISDPFTARLDLMHHRPEPETVPAAAELGRLRATTYRQLAHEVLARYGRIFGVQER